MSGHHSINFHGYQACRIQSSQAESTDGSFERKLNKQAWHDIQLHVRNDMLGQKNPIVILKGSAKKWQMHVSNPDRECHKQ